MALSDFFRKKSAYEVSNSAVNRPISVMGWNGLNFRFDSKNYAAAYLWMIFNKIFRGLHNVRYFSEGTETASLRNVTESLMLNIKTIVWLWWSYGYVIVNKDDTKPGAFCIPDYKFLKKDKDGSIIIDPLRQVVIYSDPYVFRRLSDFDVIAHDICALDTFKNGLDYLTRSLGALGLLSSKDMPMSTADKDEYNKQLKEKYGIRKEQYQILLFDTPVDFKQMTLPVKDLALDERIKDEVKLLCGYFGVPYDLIPIAGQSTYANQEQALRQFYSECISPLAEIGLTIGRQIIRESSDLILSTRLTFTIDNVPELEDDRTPEIEYKLKVVELVKQMKEAGLDTSEYEKQLKTE